MLDGATYQGAARRQLNLREALAWLCAAEVSSKEQRRLSMAQGREAVARGYTLQFTTAMELLGSLVKGQQQGTLEVRLTQYSKPKLLIIDELGYLSLEP